MMGAVVAVVRLGRWPGLFVAAALTSLASGCGGHMSAMADGGGGVEDGAVAGGGATGAGGAGARPARERSTEAARTRRPTLRSSKSLGARVRTGSFPSAPASRFHSIGTPPPAPPSRCSCLAAARMRGPPGSSGFFRGGRADWERPSVDLVMVLGPLLPDLRHLRPRAPRRRRVGAARVSHTGRSGFRQRASRRSHRSRRLHRRSREQLGRSARPVHSHAGGQRPGPPGGCDPQPWPEAVHLWGFLRHHVGDAFHAAASGCRGRRRARFRGRARDSLPVALRSRLRSGGPEAGGRMRRRSDLSREARCRSVGEDHRPLHSARRGRLSGAGARPPHLERRSRRCSSRSTICAPSCSRCPTGSLAAARRTSRSSAGSSPPCFPAQDRGPERASWALQNNIALSELWEMPPPDAAEIARREIGAFFWPGELDAGAALFDLWPRYPLDEFANRWPVSAVPVLAMNGTFDSADAGRERAPRRHGLHRPPPVVRRVPRRAPRSHLHDAGHRFDAAPLRSTSDARVPGQPHRAACARLSARHPATRVCVGSVPVGGAVRNRRRLGEPDYPRRPFPRRGCGCSGASRLGRCHRPGPPPPPVVISDPVAGSRSTAARRAYRPRRRCRSWSFPVIGGPASSR